jgi:signal transduction histidine kinase
VAVGAAVAVALHTFSAVLLRDNAYYAAFVSNVGQAVVQAAIIALMLLNVPRSNRQGRAFWILMASGVLLWLIGQCNWIYYENVLRIQVPEPSPLDFLFFVHIVPMIAAASVQPHADTRPGDVRFRLGYLDFSMLLLFWLFLYGYLLFPWQYIVKDTQIFQPRFNFVYVMENVVLVGTLAVLAMRTKHHWHRVYKHLCIAGCVYMVSSLVVNIAIDHNTYESGGIYDVPLTLAMGWFAYAAAVGNTRQNETEAPLIALQQQTYWHSLLAFAVMVAMPVMAGWAAFNIDTYSRVQHFRFFLTLFAMLLMMALFFVKHMLLDRRLISLLDESRRAYEDLQQLQGHLLQAEKLAAIGRLVAGAAHEINNPLTAIVGYSDLLASHDKLDPQHKDFAEKILQQARRTKALVQNLLTFAKQTPFERRSINVNAIVGHALQLHELDFAGKNVQIICQMHADLPSVVGDENQLLQVFLHIMNNAVDAMLEHSGGGTLVTSTDVSDGRVLWSCSDTGPGVPDPTRIFDPFFTTKPVGKGTGLGLSASYGIIRDHGGVITCHNRPEGGATFVIALPAVPQSAASALPKPRRVEA